MKFREAVIILALSIYCFQALVLPARGLFRSASHSEEETRLLDEIETGQSSSGISNVGSSGDRAETDALEEVKSEPRNPYAVQLLTSTQECSS